MLELKFPPDIFNLLFYGNKNYTNQTLYFDKFRFNSLTFQQFKIGIIKKISKEKCNHVFGVALSYNKGQKNSLISINNSYLYTGNNAENVDIKIDFINKSNKNIKGIGAFNGNGAGIDLFYKFIDDKNSLDVSVSDFGFITWNNRSKVFSRDTSFNFDGFYIDNIITIIPSETVNAIKDSLKKILGYPTTGHAYTIFTPAFSNITYTRSLYKKNVFMKAVITYNIFTLANPFILISPSYQFNFKNSNIRISPNISYGGYSGLNGGIELSGAIGKGFVFSLGTDYINSYFMPDKPAGLGGYLKLYKSI